MNTGSSKQKLKKNAKEPVDIYKEKSSDPKYKTELCKQYDKEVGCPYGNRCRFAHGKEELFGKSDKIFNYKKKDCNSFHSEFFCVYGSRCLFKHSEDIYKDCLDKRFYYLDLIRFREINVLASILKLKGKMRGDKREKIRNKIKMYINFWFKRSKNRISNNLNTGIISNIVINNKNFKESKENIKSSNYYDNISLNSNKSNSSITTTVSETAKFELKEDQQFDYCFTTSKASIHFLEQKILNKNRLEVFSHVAPIEDIVVNKEERNNKFNLNNEDLTNTKNFINETNLRYNIKVNKTNIIGNKTISNKTTDIASSDKRKRSKFYPNSNLEIINNENAHFYDDYDHDDAPTRNKQQRNSDVNSEIDALYGSSSAYKLIPYNENKISYIDSISIGDSNINSKYVSNHVNNKKVSNYSYFSSHKSSINYNAFKMSGNSKEDNNESLIISTKKSLYIPSNQTSTSISPMKVETSVLNSNYNSNCRNNNNYDYGSDFIINNHMNNCNTPKFSYNDDKSQTSNNINMNTNNYTGYTRKQTYNANSTCNSNNIQSGDANKNSGVAFPTKYKYLLNDNKEKQSGMTTKENTPVCRRSPEY